MKAFSWFFLLAILPVFFFFAGLGFDDKTGYLVSAAATAPWNEARYATLLRDREKLLQRCEASPACEILVRGRLASLKNFPVQSSLILFWKSLLDLRWKEKCRAMPWALLLTFLTQAVLALALVARAGKKSPELTGIFLLSAIAALYVLHRDINFTILSGKASAAVGLVALAAAASFCGRDRLGCILALCLLPFMHVGQATFLTLFFVLILATDFIFSREKELSLAAAIAGFTGCLLYSWMGFRDATSEALPIARIVGALLPPRWDLLTQFWKWDTVGVLSLVTITFAVVVARRRTDEISTSRRYWILLGGGLVFLWGVWVFQLGMAGARPLGAARDSMTELFDRIYGNLEFVVLSLPLLVSLRVLEHFRPKRLAPATWLCVALLPFAFGTGVKLVSAVPGSLALARVETCQAVSIPGLQKRLHSSEDWTQATNPSETPEFHLLLFLYLQGD